MAVLRVDPDVVPDADTPRGEGVGDAVGPLVELGERQPDVPVDQGQAIGDGVDGVLEDVGDVEVDLADDCLPLLELGVTRDVGPRRFGWRRLFFVVK